MWTTSIFCGFYSQGDGAAFAGKVYVYEWMEIMKLDEQYPIAYLACKSDGSYVTLRKGSGYNMFSNLEEQLCYSEPEGLFAELDVDEWHELVNEQFDAMSVETEILTYCEDLAKDLYKSLRDEYDSLTSEEAFIDSCECNEITFEEIEDEEGVLDIISMGMGGALDLIGCLYERKRTFNNFGINNNICCW